MEGIDVCGDKLGDDDGEEDGDLDGKEDGELPQHNFVASSR